MVSKGVPSETLNYEGKVPDFKYYEKLSADDYNKMISEYSNVKWKAKDEIIKYKKNDVIILDDVVNKFSIEIFDLYSLNITKISTLAGLALLTFTSGSPRPCRGPLACPLGAFGA